MTFLSSKNFLLVAKWFFITAIIFILQLYLAPLLACKGVVPNFLLSLIILAALTFGLETALPIAVLTASIFQHFLYDQYFFISWLLAPFLAIFVYPQLGFSRKVINIFQVAFCTFYIELINTLLLSFSRGLNSISENYLILIGSPLLNVLVAVPILFLIEKVFQIEE